MTPKRSILAAARALARDTAEVDADWDWIRRALMRMLTNRISDRRGLRMPWPLPPGATPPLSAFDDTADILTSMDTTGWDMPEAASLYEILLEHDLTDDRRVVHNPDPRRKAVGVYYTPPALAAAMCQATLAAGLRQADELNPDAGPDAVLAVIAYDPACGGGVFLAKAAQWLAREWLAREYATRCGVGTEDEDVLCEVITTCVYGQDIDPTGVDLAKTALWWETGGRLAITLLSPRVAVGDTLAGDLPPALADRYREEA